MNSATLAWGRLLAVPLFALLSAVWGRGGLPVGAQPRLVALLALPCPSATIASFVATGGYPLTHDA